MQTRVAVGVVGFVAFCKYRGDPESLQAVRQFGLCVSAWVKVFLVLRVFSMFVRSVVVLLAFTFASASEPQLDCEQTYLGCPEEL